MTSMLRLVFVLAALLALAMTGPTLAAADEAKTPISASMILNVISQPVESRQAAFDESLRNQPPLAAGLPAGEVMPDGSVRYGRTTVTVKNPCPPGTAHYEPPPLPGRRARN